jgi:hypothetical protein
MTARIERIPGPMPYHLRAMLERDNQADADAAVRAVAHYAGLELAHHGRAWRLPNGTTRRAHRFAAAVAARALAAELAELAPPRRIRQ